MIAENELKELLEKYSMNEITKIRHCSLCQIQYWAKKYNLESKFETFRAKKSNRKRRLYNPKLPDKVKYQSKIDKLKSFPLDEINEKFQKGYNWRQINKEYKISLNLISFGFKEEIFLPIPDKIKKEKLQRGRHRWSEKDKKKISKRMTKYFADHPEKFPWRDKKHFQSVPCEKFKEWLQTQNVKFAPECQPFLKEKRFYSVDVAFPDRRIGIEINGTQHYNSDGSLRPYYVKRKDFFESRGWKLLQIPYTYCYKIDDIKDKVFDFINSNGIVDSFDYDNYKMKIYTYPSDEELNELVWTKPLCKLAIDLKVGTSSLSEHCIKHRINIPPKGYWFKFNNIKNIKSLKGNYPSFVEIFNDIWNKSVYFAAKKYNISDGSLKKYCKCRKIPLPNKEYRDKRKNGLVQECEQIKKQIFKEWKNKKPIGLDDKVSI